MSTIKSESVNDDQLISPEDQSINVYYQIATNQLDNQQVDDKYSDQIVVDDFGNNPDHNRIKSGKSDLVNSEIIGEVNGNQVTINSVNNEQVVIENNQTNRLNSPRILETLVVESATTMKTYSEETETRPNDLRSSIVEIDGKNFIISWSQLTYRVKLSTFDKLVNKIRGVSFSTDSRIILRSLQGSFASGQLTALMGPSGAGKSTLLECIAGMRLKGLDGSMRCIGREKISIAFIPQQDHLYELLTVREALMYASELQHSRIINGTRVNYSTDDHINIVDSILRQLNLEVCADTKIGRISGGQLKRVSIAQELVARPDILIMDEPTSGLDSSTCYQLMEMLADLTSSTPIAIVMTIHQPSARVFNMFNKVYMLSRVGKFIYEGTPDGVVSSLSRVNINCDKFYNPADLLVEVASGDYGTEVIQSMASNVEIANINNANLSHNKNINSNGQFLGANGHSANWITRSTPLIHSHVGELSKLQSTITPMVETPTISSAVQSSSTNDHMTSLAKVRLRPVTPFTRHFLILLSRQFLVMVRDPLLGVLRFVFAINIGLTLGALYNGVGVYSGCTPDIRGKANLDHMEEVKQAIEDQVRSTQDNIGSLYFLLLYSCLANLMPMAVAIPMEIKIFAKERYNGWYKTSSYYMAKGIAEVPFIIGTNVVVVTLHFLFTSQPLSRYFDTFVIYFLVSLVSQTHGIMCGAFLMNNIVASVFTAPNTTVPLILFSGFFIRQKAMPIIFQYASYCSYLRWGFEGFMVSVFGFNRCEPQLTKAMINAKNQLGFFLNSMFRMARLSIAESNEEPEDLILKNQTDNLTRNIVNGIGGSWFNEENQSGAISYYDLDDSAYLRAIYALLATLMIGRLLTYYILKWKGNLQK
ncbi:ATP-binding cassette sub-family G member 1-like [Panonychus citri]|uniref:ATP-binding cassette sub-family G member 1-like n=1 Tax=Panonychus citri TaxID=50023 RepID=UPI002307A7CF|nr:ATP-binding cassette sub-family G member 1-like [Panonychus citri]